MFFFGGGKCPNLGVVNVRILGVVNVLLANDSQSNIDTTCDFERFQMCGVAITFTLRDCEFAISQKVFI